MKLYQFRQDSTTQHKPSTAVLTRFRFLLQISSSGYEEWLVGFEIKLLGKTFRRARVVSKNLGGNDNG